MCTYTLEVLRCVNCNTHLGTERANSKPCAKVGKDCAGNKKTRIQKRTVPIDECSRCFMMTIIEEQETLAAAREAEHARAVKAAKKRAFKLSFENKDGDCENGESNQSAAIDVAASVMARVLEDEQMSESSEDEHLSVFDRTTAPLEIFFFDFQRQSLPAYWY